jgi:hypothetical protein
MKRLRELAEKMQEGGDSTLAAAWPVLAEALGRRCENQGDARLLDAFKGTMSTKLSREGLGYLAVIRSLGQNEAESGSAWLQSIVDEAVAEFSRAIQ